MAVLNVANNNDSGAGSLRQAVLSASNGDTIVFDAGIAGKTINLTTGQLLLNKNLTIDGSNRNITISGFNNSRVFAIPAGNSVILNELSFINGNGTGAGFPAGVGGAIINSGTLTANKVNVRNNQANFGGGIASGTGSTFNLNQSTIDSNQAATAAGGIFVGTGIATISESTISRNISPQASAFQLQRGTATLSNSTVSNNFSPVGGSQMLF